MYERCWFQALNVHHRCCEQWCKMIAIQWWGSDWQLPSACVAFSFLCTDTGQESLFGVVMPRQTDKSVHLPFLLSFFSPCPLICFSPGQIWQLIPNSPEDNSKGQRKQTVEKMYLSFSSLSSERRQQHLLTLPYLPQTLEGTSFIYNSTPCISFTFCLNISPELAPLPSHSPFPPSVQPGLSPEVWVMVYWPCTWGDKDLQRHQSQLRMRG